MSGNDGPLFVTLGMFIIDEFEFKDDNGNPIGKGQKSQIGGGGTYAVIGARIWLSPDKIGMVVDKGYDFPGEVRENLLAYGEAMWMFRDQPHCLTTRALNLYHGEHREYLTDRIRITPRDINGTKLGRPHSLHFICSPTRAKQILSEVQEVGGWNPTVIYEPIPLIRTVAPLRHCLPSKKCYNTWIFSAQTLKRRRACSPFALPPNKSMIEKAASKFLDFGIATGGHGSVVIRSGQLGAYVKSRGKSGVWIDAFWTGSQEDARHVVDVTGAGNSFLGGLAAGLTYTEGDVVEATLFGAVSASFTIEQEGLPLMTLKPENQDWPNWNGDSPRRRLAELRKRIRK